MSKEQSNPILGAIDNINTAFEEFKKTNDERLEAEEKGNEARAKELSEKLERIEDEITKEQKRRKDEERKASIMQERVEILEAANDRPGKTLDEQKSEVYEEKFLTALRGKFKDSEKNAEMTKAYREMQEAKTVRTDVAISGGHGVPEDISRDIEDLMLRSSDILQVLTLKTVGTSDYKELLSINSTGSAWAAELGTRSQSADPNLRQIAPTIGELYTYLFASNEALEDIFFDIRNWFVRTAAESAAKALDLAVWSGNGTARPTGMINTTPVSTADGASPIRAAAAYQYIPTDSASPQVLGFDDVLDLVYALNRAYRRNAQFGGNQNTQAALRKLKDSNGQYLWQPSLQAGQPDRLVGYNVFTFEDMADPTTADGIYLGFGDWDRAYTLITRTGLAITTDDNITTPGTVKFYIRRRFGGIPANNDALKFLKLADT
jgi:HK97 family phage major capsid protein